MGRWSDETTVAFVKLYRKEQVLWDPSMPDYRDQNVRAHAIRRIVCGMTLPNFDTTEVTKKIKALRSTYHQEVAKMRNSSEGAPYTPVVPWFKDMEYIMLSAGNLNWIQAPTTEMQPAEQFVNYELMPLKPIASATDREETSEIHEKEDPPIIEKHPRRLKRKYQMDGGRQRNTALDRIEDILYSLNRIMNIDGNSTNVNKVEDECEVMGKLVALQLRELPKAERIKANIDIQKLLMEYRLKNASGLTS